MCSESYFFYWLEICQHARRTDTTLTLKGSQMQQHIFIFRLILVRFCRYKNNSQPPSNPTPPPPPTVQSLQIVFSLATKDQRQTNVVINIKLGSALTQLMLLVWPAGTNSVHFRFLPRKDTFNI